MQRYHFDREVYGPEFDDRLIKLVRENPAIYDVSHPNYRRNPVRVAIWERIAKELGASSRFLQTKWKNIRYNYLQEIKCLETGHINTNIRKRRFTEDLSFLQNTAQLYNVKKSFAKNTFNNSDSESNSYMYPDTKLGLNAFEVIEIEHSDEDGECDADIEEYTSGGDDALTKQKQYIESNGIVNITSQNISKNITANDLEAEDISHPSSPLLTPSVAMGNGDGSLEIECKMHKEITIEPIPKFTKLPRNNILPQHARSVPPNEILANAGKHKSMPTPLPDLTPINDPIELYCLSLVDSLRSMPRSERERVKYEFAKILKDAKYKDQS